MFDWLISAAAAAALTLSVGPNEKFHTIADALASVRNDLSKTGTVITVDPGTYAGTQVKSYESGWEYLGIPLTIQGKPGGPRPIIKDSSPAIMTTSGAGKAWFVPWAHNPQTGQPNPGTWTFRHLEISQARRGDPYGSMAGIRTENGWPASLVVDDCYFHDNDNGILGPEAGGSLTLTNSLFDHNGAGDGFSHNIYIGFATSATVSDSEFRRANVGHEFKSRAKESTLTRVKAIDGPDGTASYGMDFPNGGKVLVTDSVIEKGPKASNNFAFHVGGEGVHVPTGGVNWPVTEVTIRNTVFVNDKAGDSWAILNQTDKEGGLDITVTCEDCKFYGYDRQHLAIGKVQLIRPVMLTARPQL